jgi:hypothetical protein
MRFGTMSSLGPYIQGYSPSRSPRILSDHFTPTLVEFTITNIIGKKANTAPEAMVCPKQDPVSMKKKPAKLRSLRNPNSKEMIVPTLHNQLSIGEI